MLRSIRIRDFLGVTIADITFGAFNVLYGPNGAGKTTVAEAILHVLTGETLRGGKLPELVRQGGRSFEVELVLADDGYAGKGTALMRRRTRSGKGETFVNGMEVKDAEFAAHVQETLGASPVAIASALRAGALLEVKPAELLALLAGLSEAEFTPAAIAEAFPKEAKDAAARLALSLPGTLDGFALVESRAIAVRQDHFRAIELLAGEIRHLPAVSEALLAQAANLSDADIDARAQELHRKRDAALRSQSAAAAHAQGAREEKLRALKGDIAALEKMEPAAAVEDVAGLEAEVRGAEDAALRALTALSRARDTLAETEAAARGSTDLPAGAETIDADLANAEADVVTAKNTFDTAAKEGARLKALASAVTAGADCPTCGTRLTAEHKATLDSLLQKTREGWVGAKADVEKADALVVKLRTLKAETDAVRARQAAAAKLPALRQAVTDAEAAAAKTKAALGAAQAKLDAARPGAEAAARYAMAQRELARFRTELAKLEAEKPVEPSTENVADIDARLANIDALRKDRAVVANRQALTDRRELAQQAHADADLLAKACGTKGVRLQLVGAAVQPFLDAANHALSQLAPGYAVEAETEKEFALVVVRGHGDAATRLRPEQLSDGERTRVLYVLQLAVARLAGVDLLVLDRAELVDETGRRAVKKLAATCAADGIQVLMLTCAAAPPAAVPGLNAWVVEAGTARPVGGKVAA
jgi:exonuclease SbcC